MPTIASTAAHDMPLRSASTITVVRENGQHLLKIDGYSFTKDVPSGSHIRSRSFRVGGHSWHIGYYPNGINSTYANYISIFQELDYNVAQVVKAQFAFSILDHVGNPVPSYTRTSNVRNFQEGGAGWLAFISRDELERSGHLRDDCFTISCHLTVIKEIRTEDIDVAIPQSPHVAAMPPSNLQQHLSGLLATGDGVDVTFVVDDKMFAAHRCVLAARSSVFREEFFGPTKESTTTNVVRIDDMEARDFEVLLCFIYTDSLPETKGEEEAAMLPDLVAAANRYNMERLRLICEDKLCEYVDASTVVIMLEFAEEQHCHGLKKACLEFLNHPTNLRAVMTADGLEHLTKICPSVLKELITKLVAAP